MDQAEPKFVAEAVDRLFEEYSATIREIMYGRLPEGRLAMTAHAWAALFLVKHEAEQRSVRASD